MPSSQLERVRDSICEEIDQRRKQKRRDVEMIPYPAAAMAEKSLSVIQVFQCSCRTLNAVS